MSGGKPKNTTLADGGLVALCGAEVGAVRLAGAVDALLQDGARVVVLADEAVLAVVDLDDEKRVHVVRVAACSPAELARIAHSYGCRIVSCDLVEGRCDWRAPLQARAWLKELAGEGHVYKFSFDSHGVFSTSLHLGRHVKPRSVSQAEPEENPPQLPERAAQLTADLAAGAATAPRTPSPAPHSGAVESEAVGPQSNGRLVQWVEDTAFPACSVAFLPGEGMDPGKGGLICVACRERSGWLFPYAKHLRNHVGDMTAPLDDDPALLAIMRGGARVAKEWRDCDFATVEHEGLRAIGFGHNKICRHRACMVAMAATSALAGRPFDANLIGQEAIRWKLFLARLGRFFGHMAKPAEHVTDGTPAPGLEQPQVQETLAHLAAQNGFEPARLEGVLATAVEAWAALEGGGYLELLDGDVVLVTHGVLEHGGCPGDAADLYAFGTVVESVARGGILPDVAGWFPAHRVVLLD